MTQSLTLKLAECAASTSTEAIPGEIRERAKQVIVDEMASAFFGLNRDQPNGRGSNVTITTANGLAVSRRVDFPRGHSRRGGVAWSDLSGKWHDLLPGHDVDRTLALAQRLEDIDDVHELSNAFSATS